MTNRLEEAIGFAVSMHRGQEDKAGFPFILHPLGVLASTTTNEESVKEIMDAGFDLEDIQIVAVLHDVVEDAKVPLDALRREYGDTIADALDAISRRRGESYEDYIDRVMTNEIAHVVKAFDIKNNVERLHFIPSLDERERLETKYARALLRMLGVSWEMLNAIRS